jgi:hypothetical protein
VPVEPGEQQQPSRVQTGAILHLQVLLQPAVAAVAAAPVRAGKPGVPVVVPQEQVLSDRAPLAREMPVERGKLGRQQVPAIWAAVAAVHRQPVERSQVQVLRMPGELVEPGVLPVYPGPAQHMPAVAVAVAVTTGRQQLAMLAAVAPEPVELVVLQGTLLLQTSAVAVAVAAAVRVLGAPAAPVSSSSGTTNP